MKALPSGPGDVARTRLDELGKGHDERVAGKDGAEMHQIKPLFLLRRTLHITSSWAARLTAQIPSGFHTCSRR